MRNPALNEEKADIIFLHIGSNDIDFRQIRPNTVENIGKDVINVGQKCRESGVSKVIISFVLLKNILSLQNLLGS